MNEQLREFRREDHISHAQIQTYMICPLKYRFQYIEGLPPAFTPASLAFGSSIHKAIGHYYREIMKSGKRPTLEEVQLCLEEAWELANKSEFIRYRTKDTKESLMKLGFEMLTAFYEGQQEAEIISVEAAFSVPLINPNTGETLQASLVGAIDLIEKDNKGITVVDLKTAVRRYSEANVDNSLQMSIYGYAVTMNGMTQDQDVLLRYDVLIKTKKPQLLRYYTVRDTKDHARLFRLINEVARGIQGEVFFPNQGYCCADCGYTGQCTQW